MNPANSQNNRTTTLVGFALAGISLYWMFTYSGPYRYLAELQIKWFGSYVPKLTVLLVILGLLGLGGLIKLIFRGAERPIPGSAPQTVAAIAAPATTGPEPWQKYIRYAVLLFPFGLGGWAYYNGTHARNLQQLSAVDFQNGNMHSHIVYADVRGHLSGKYLEKGKYLYIPMSGEAKEASPVRLVVGVSENEMKKYLRREADGTFSVRGVADMGLESDVKYAFEKNGIAVADPVWVVHAGRDPEGDRKFGLIMMGVGVVFAAFVFGLESYRRRKNTTARPLQVNA